MVSSHVVISIEWTFLALSYVLVIARIYVRLCMRRDRLHLSDGWLIAALAAAQGLVICDTLTYKMHAMDNFSITSVSLDKIRFATNYFFDVAMYLPKFSIISFYHNLVPPTHPGMRKALYVLTAITLVSALTTFFGDTFWCGPNPAVNWSKGEDACSVFASMELMRLNWSLNFITEVLNLVFPFPLIKEVKLPRRREKISLAIIFGLGLLTISVSVGRFITMLKLSNDISIYIWATAELCISIMVVALTALRPLLRKISSMISTSVSSSDNKSGYKLPSLEQRTQPKACVVRPESMIYWRSGEGSFHSRVVTTRPGESTESQVELNNLNRDKIIKTEEVLISREAYPNLGEEVDSRRFN
ncbi:hypothetical protein B0T10DRAFT_539133 [Thelonectria olida]|uniref:Rhodopsin domain-containing protein n=1 Tax=Thelonectria olida TaxID=1576542 RepID=A0A9P8W463_9HYPO|nr:hypothetical protein B0T10DRAFT_539133 [Thelonectria olida]